MVKILIVDDEAILTMYLEEILIQNGYHVVGSGASGREAIELAQSLSPDLIIMDISMPGDMDGIEAARIIRSDFGIPSIFMTAHSESPIFEKAREADPYGYLIKPVQNIGTRIVVDNAIRRIHAERKLRENEQRFSDIVYSTADWVWETDEKGKICYTAGNLMEILGYTHEELLGKTAGSLISEDSLEEFCLFLKGKAAQKEAFYNYPINMKRKTGDRVRIQTTGLPILDRDGCLKGYRGANKDVSLSVNTPLTLKEFENQFRCIMDYLNIGLNLISPEFKLLLTNQTMDRWFPRRDFSPNCKCYHIYRNRSQNEPCPHCIVKMTLEDGEVHESAMEINTEDGRRAFRRISFPVRGRDEKIIGAIELIMNLKD